MRGISVQGRMTIYACAAFVLMAWGAVTAFPEHRWAALAVSSGVALFGALLSAGLQLDRNPRKVKPRASRDATSKTDEWLSHLATIDEQAHWARSAFHDGLMFLAAGMTDAAGRCVTVCKGDEAEIPLKLPVPAKVADELLASTMKLMGRDDRYYAVSNAAIWLTLKEFEKSQETAVRNGATIKRVFVIDDETDDAVSVEAISRVIHEHDGYTRTWRSDGRGGGYLIRALTRTEYRAVAPDLSRMLHFGVFYPGVVTKLPVAFKVMKEDLSEFRVSTAAKTSPYIAEFQKLWDAAKPLSDSETRYGIRRHLFRRMSPGGRYLAVCSVDGWQEWRRAKFHKEMIELAKEKDLKIQRIFISSPNVTDEKLKALLAEEKKLSDGSNGCYECRLGQAESAPTVSEGRSKIAYAEAIAHVDRDALIEESSESDALTADKFDDLWYSAKEITS